MDSRDDEAADRTRQAPREPSSSLTSHDEQGPGGVSGSESGDLLKSLIELMINGHGDGTGSSSESADGNQQEQQPAARFYPENGRLAFAQFSLIDR